MQSDILIRVEQVTVNKTLLLLQALKNNMKGQTG